MKQADSRQKYYLTALLIAIITALVFIPLLKNSFILWDDDEYIIENLHIRHLDWLLVKWAFTGFVQGNWHPLTNLSHALDFALWGQNPFGHHLSSLIIHSVNTLLVVLLVVKIFEQRKVLADGGIIVAAAVTGILFGIHPLHVESVAWAAERKDLLCGLFYLLALISYINSAGREQALSSGSTLFKKELLTPLSFFILALLSKPMAVSLPLVLLILDRYLFRRIDSSKSFVKAVLEKLPFILAALCVSIATVSGQLSGILTTPQEFIPLYARMLVAIRGFWGYLEKIILPFGLTPIYPYPKAAEITIMSLQYILPAAATAIIFMALVRNFRRPGWCQSLWLYYLVTLLPVIGIIQVGHQFMADRYSYLPAIAPFLAVGIGSAWLRERCSGSRLKWMTVTTVALVLFSGLVYLTIRQITFWRDSTTFWSHVIEREPHRIPFAYINRGLAYWEKGEYGKALVDLNRAVELEPTDFKAYNNRGLVLTDAGQPDKAIADFDRAIALFSNDPSAYYNRGNAYRKLGESDLAVADFSIAISMNPDDMKARNNRGLVFQERGDLERALAEYNDALALRPEDWMTLNNRGLLLSAMGESDRALDDFNCALRHNSDESSIYINRGLAFSAKNLDSEALSDFDQAIRLKPDDSRAYNNRALIHAKQGEFTAALLDFNRALELVPFNASVHLNRGIILLKTGAEPLARKDFEQACALGEKRGCGFLK